MSVHLDHRPPDPQLHRKLHAWVAAAIITPQEADAIEDFESGKGIWVSVQPSARRVPLVTEALGYLGAVLALAAGIVLLADRWSDLPEAVTLSAIGIAAAFALASGWLVRDNAEPAIRRLGSVLWAGSVVLVAWFAAGLAMDVLETSDRTSGIIASVAGAVVAGGLYALRRQALQQLALFAALCFVVGFVFQDEVAIGVVMLLLALGWFALGWRGVLEPKRIAFGLGSLGVLIGPMLIAGEATAVGLLIGLAMAAMVVGAGVLVHEAPLLGIGVVGLFGFLIRTITYFFEGTVAVPIALLAAGAIVLTVALALARRYGTTRTGPRSPS